MGQTSTQSWHPSGHLVVSMASFPSNVLRILITPSGHLYSQALQVGHFSLGMSTLTCIFRLSLGDNAAKSSTGLPLKVTFVIFNCSSGQALTQASQSAGQFRVSILISRISSGKLSLSKTLRRCSPFNETFIAP